MDCLYLFIISGLLLYFIYSMVYRLKIKNVNQKYVFITGCDRGFGYMFTERLLSLGFHVFSACLTQEGRSKLEEDFKTYHDKLDTVVMDIRSEEDVARVRKTIEQKLQGKGLWGLVNNAGVMGPTSVDDFLNVDDYYQPLNINCYGTIRVTQAFKHLVKKSKGRIVVNASIMGRVPKSHFAPYIVSKHALEAYCDCIRLELIPFRVSVHILEPGGFKTELTDPESIVRRFQPIWHRAPQSLRDEYGPEYKKGVEECIRNSVGRCVSTDLEWVIKAYQHAITGLYPLRRYVVGWDAILFFVPFSYLPTPVQDFISTTMEKIIVAPIPRVCEKRYGTRFY